MAVRVAVAGICMAVAAMCVALAEPVAMTEICHRGQQSRCAGCMTAGSVQVCRCAGVLTCPGCVGQVRGRGVVRLVQKQRSDHLGGRRGS